VDSHKLSFRPQCEEMEEKNAPSTLTVTPPATGVAPITATVADQGCTSGITAHATTASGGVVSCS
jgi:hypothetical protein